MATAESFRADSGRPPAGPSPPRGLLDLLSVAPVVLDTDGRIVLWSPQAEELFGYTAREALGEYAGRLLVHEQHLELVIKLFVEVTSTGQSWAGAFPVRHKDGSDSAVCCRSIHRTMSAWRSPPATSPPMPPARSAGTGSTSFP
ncbi:hypothetical protein GCM10020367_58370 [Streptomyces sannanensis]|uniref:PAS domain-containing protein n=1 Tax=Streptomyces sannanensis TaxID=285536 RepID=A0ABP6SKZ1_9ACTN